MSEERAKESTINVASTDAPKQAPPNPKTISEGEFQARALAGEYGERSQRLIRRAIKAQSVGNSLSGAGKGMSHIGVALTIAITVPLLLAVFFGISGFVIGVVIAIVFFAIFNHR